MCLETIQEFVHMDRTCVAKNIFGETRVSKTCNSRNLETEVSPWKRIRCNIFRSHYARGILKRNNHRSFCIGVDWLNPIFWQNSRTQYGSWITFSVKSTRQATNFSMRTELTSWINSYSTKQATDSGRDTCFLERPTTSLRLTPDSISTAQWDSSMLTTSTNVSGSMLYQVVSSPSFIINLIIFHSFICIRSGIPLRIQSGSTLTAVSRNEVNNLKV